MRRLSLAVLLVALGASTGAADTVLTFRYTPAPRVQLALWIEDAQGVFLRTVALTEAVAYRGIGNRPGASGMNSGYRWPYGRREGVLPIWAHRRAAAPGARLFPRVIFQARGEGNATQATSDESEDAYYCLSFDMKRATREGLDAVSCASLFSSDKGRYLTAQDLAAGYFEPWQEMVPGMPAPVDSRQLLPLESLYPPRMDVARCNEPGVCFDHADVTRFAEDARAVMPEIDAITKATPPGNVAQELLFNVPAEWPPGNYTAFLEVALEGDYNTAWNDKTHPPPTAPWPTPGAPPSDWDTYSTQYGYAYRGQPSLVWKVGFQIGAAPSGQFGANLPEARSSWQVWNRDYGRFEPFSMSPGDPGQITADQPASGVNRLQPDADGRRFIVETRDTSDPMAAPDTGGPIGPTEELRASRHPDPLRAHTWVMLHLLAARSTLPLHAYEVRVSTLPITDEESFIRDGREAKNATNDREGATFLSLPTDVPAGSPIDVAIGDLSADTQYYIGVRATNVLNQRGPIRVTEITTAPRRFATVTPCFVATAAYGSPLAREVAVLRQVRDRYLSPIAPGRAAVEAYYAASAPLASVIADEPLLRAAARAILTPLVRLFSSAAALRL